MSGFSCSGPASAGCAGVLPFRSVFLSVPCALAQREPLGTRDTTPVSCRLLRSWPPRHAALAAMVLAAASRSIALRPDPGAGCTGGAFEEEPAGAGWVGRNDRVARPSSRARGARHVGSSLAPVSVRPWRLRHFARRHYRLAPRSDGAEGWRRSETVHGCRSVESVTHGRWHEDEDLRPKGRRLAGDVAGLGRPRGAWAMRYAHQAG